MPEKFKYRVTVFLKRNPNMTEEEFSHHWYNVHGPLVAPWILKHKISQYTQFHTPSALRSKTSSNSLTGNESLNYDGGAEFYIESYEAFEAAFKDPYYINVIEPDEHNFTNKGSPSQTTIVGAVSTLGISKNIVYGGKSLVPDADLSEEQRKLL